MKEPKKPVRWPRTARQTLGAKVEETEASKSAEEVDRERDERAARRRAKKSKRFGGAKGKGIAGAVKLPAKAKEPPAEAKGPPTEAEAPSAEPKAKRPTGAGTPAGAKATSAKAKAKRPARPDRSAKRERGSRPKRGAGAAKAGAGLVSALRQGATETRKRSRGLPTRVGRTVNAGLVTFFGIFFDVVAFLFNVGLVAFGLLTGPGRALLGRIVAFVALISRLLTPARALALVVVGAAVLLALSQFADYRGVSIGTDAYSDVNTVAPAPEIDRRETGEAHSYAMIPVAVACLALLVPVMRGRWRLSRLIALGGVAAIVVGLVVDRSAGLDPGDAAQAYQGVEASLLGGFYAQLFAGLLLAVSALLLGRELKLAAESKSVPAREPRRASRKLLRRRPRAEGARA